MVSTYMTENYYQVLGVERAATADDIKKSYRKLARKYHPDLSKESDAVEKMQAINVAYDVLSNPEKKAQYDHELDHPQGFTGFDGNQYQHTGGQSDFSGFEDIFSRFGTGFGGSYYQDAFQRGTGQQQYSQSYRGEDQHAKIEVDIAVAYHGTTQTVSLQIPSYTPFGQAELIRKTLEIKIPKGMKAGQQIRLMGQGQAGINGGASGDLYIEINYKQNTLTYVENSDVYHSIHISPWQAELGGQIGVTTPAGQLNVNLPRHSKTGQKLRLKDQGIPNTQQKGHLYLILNIVLPEAKTQEQQQAYRDFAQQFPNFQPH